MIFSSIKNLSENDFGQKYMACAAEFLATHNLDELPLGKTEIDGDNVFVNIMEFEPALPGEKDYEAHKIYADIHVVISGTESIAVAPLEQCVLKGEFNADADFGAYTNPGEETWVTLHAGDFLVTPPSDAHKPGCTLEKSGSKLKKAVMKVRIK